MPKSAAIVPLSGSRDIDGVLWGVKWTLPALTYSFPAKLSQFTGHPDGAIDGFRPLRAAQIKAVNDIADRINALIETELQFTPDAASADIRLSTASSLKLPGFAGSGKIETAIGLSPDQSRTPTYAFGDIFFNRVDYALPQAGNYAYQTMMHELGHALGLKHGHADQPSPDGDGVIGKLPKVHDTLEYSVMTYRSSLGDSVKNGYNNAYDSFPQSFMMNDIAALQYLYGADYTHNDGDTIYRWSPKTGELFINGKGQCAPVANKVFLTIWDGGGIDTFDFSNYRTAGGMIINLSPGESSIVSYEQLAILSDQYDFEASANVYNSYLHADDTRSLIENAIGGPFNDTITGNDGDNVLEGRSGDDEMWGLAGDDVLIGGNMQDRLDGGKGQDTLIGGNGNDVLSGGNGDDLLVGGQDVDNLNGGNGDDRLVGSPGTDGFRGDAGNDVFALSLGNGKYPDEIYEYSTHGRGNDDSIELDHKVFSGLNEGTLDQDAFELSRDRLAGTPDIRIFYFVNSIYRGELYYDPDGNGSERSILVAYIKSLADNSVPVLTLEDFIIV